MFQNGAKAVKNGSGIAWYPWCDHICRILANYGVAQSRTSNCGMQRNKQHPLCVYTVVQLRFKHVYSGHLTFLTVRPPFYSPWVGLFKRSVCQIISFLWQDTLEKCFLLSSRACSQSTQAYIFVCLASVAGFGPFVWSR